jgi:mannose-6-phosphate isomerase-like protein (cupin superfamily)
MEISLEGWDIQSAHAGEWLPWGAKGDARAKILGTTDGYMVTYVEADAGYQGDPHVHGNPEFFYLIEGTVRNQGREMVAGDGYAAAANSAHADFATDTGARYIVIFKL